MGNAHTFAPKGIPIAGAVISAVVGLVLLIGRGLGKTPAGFSERAKNKYYFSMLGDVLALGVFYLCVALDKQFGHNLIAGHWVADGLWLALAIANVCNTYSTSMAFSADERYALITSGMMAVQSALFFMGARSTDSANAPLVVTVIACALWLGQSYYFVRWCVPPEDRQRKVGSTYTYYRVWHSITLAIYPIMYGIDVTYGNKFHDKERDPWIILLVVSSGIIHGVNTLLCNFVFNTEDLPPFGFWSGVPDAETTNAGGLATAGLLKQDFAPDAAAQPSAGPADAVAVPVQEATNSRYGGYQFQ